VCVGAEKRISALSFQGRYGDSLHFFAPHVQSRTDIKNYLHSFIELHMTGWYNMHNNDFTP
ncbi:MAG: hypothetical protein MJ077_11610, partial [Oscillospiraceae bacterium]|nr:hypothetical protein [Oscillospiraceae bacterium]